MASQLNKPLQTHYLTGQQANCQARFSETESKHHFSYISQPDPTVSMVSVCLYVGPSLCPLSQKHSGSECATVRIVTS